MIFDPKIGTKTTPKRPKRGPKQLLFSSSIYASIWCNFLLHFGSILGPFWHLKIILKSILFFLKIMLSQHDSQDHPKRSQDRSKRPKDQPKTAPGPPKTAPRPPKMAPSPRKRPPTRLQEITKGPPRGPKPPTEAPRAIQ